MQTAIMYDVSYEKRKRIMLIGMILIAALLIVCFTSPLAHAVNRAAYRDLSLRTWYDKRMNEVAKELGEGLLGHVQGIFSSSHTGSTTEIARLLSNMTHAASSAIQQTEIISFFRGIGIGLAAVYAFANLFSELSRGDGNIEMWAKCFVVMLTGIIVVQYWASVYIFVQALGTAIVDKMKQGASTGTEPLTDWVTTNFAFGDEDLYNGPWHTGIIDFSGSAEYFENIRLYFITFWKLIRLYAIYVLTQIAMMPGDVALISMWVEKQLRHIAMPLALADVAGNGLRSPGVLYIKKFLALYLRIGMCFVVAGLCSAMAGTVLLSGSTNFTMGLARLIVIVTIYMSASRLYSGTSTIAAQVIGA